MGFKVSRFDNIQFGHKPKLVDYVFEQKDVFSAKIVDDSSYTPNSDYIRTQLASGNPFSKGSYDFDDGKDNGFTPAVRGLSYDMAEVDSALKAVVENAKEAKSKAEKESVKAAKDARDERILNSVDPESQSDSQSSE